jgi:hypothetical protein
MAEREVINDISLFNVCGGAADERFMKAAQEIVQNIANPNTAVRAKRKIVMTFEFLPYKDRKGAEVTMSIKNTLATDEAISGNIFISSASGRIKGYNRNVDQAALGFEPAASENKQ